MFWDFDGRALSRHTFTVWQMFYLCSRAKFVQPYCSRPVGCLLNKAIARRQGKKRARERERDPQGVNGCIALRTEKRIWKIRQHVGQTGGFAPTATCTGLEKHPFYRVFCLSGVHELQDNDLSGFSRHPNKTRSAVQSLPLFAFREQTSMWTSKKGVSREKIPQMLIGGRALQTGQTQQKY